MPTKRIAFRRYAIEAVTIMFGILAALLLDAAWDYRSDRADERAYLQGLEAEFSAARAEIVQDQVRREEMLGSATSVLQALRGDQELEAAALASVVLDLLDYRFYTPSHPVLDEVVNSGRLSVLRSRNLRFRLRRYVQERDRLEVVEQRDLDFVADQMAPFLAENVSLESLSDWSDGPSAEGGRQLSRLMSMDRFGSLVYLRWSELRTSTAFASGVLRNIDRVLAELE